MYIYYYTLYHSIFRHHLSFRITTINYRVIVNILLIKWIRVLSADLCLSHHVQKLTVRRAVIPVWFRCSLHIMYSSSIENYNNSNTGIIRALVASLSRCVSARITYYNKFSSFILSISCGAFFDDVPLTTIPLVYNNM